jgi:nucleoredoxin
MRKLIAAWVAGGLVGVAWAALPEEVTVTAPTRLELITNGKPGGAVSLRQGERLAVVSAGEGFVVVRYRNLNGRVPVGHTDLPRTDELPAAEPHLPAVESAPPPPAAKGAGSAAVAPVAVAPGALAATPASVARPAYEPATPVERSLAGKLVALEAGTLGSRDAAHLAGVRFFGLYFSASWCGPCRQFSPDLIDAYGKIRALYPEFEVVLVNRDRSVEDMVTYMRDERMPWPALRWDALRTTPEITRYAGSGIPCLVLIDAEGKVLSDSYRWGRYVGPDAVLADTWKILRDYRRQHPRPRP